MRAAVPTGRAAHIVDGGVSPPQELNAPIESIQQRPERKGLTDGMPAPRASILGYVKWVAPRTLYSLADQAATSLANFAISLLLARYLTVSEYAAFTLSYSAFLLVGMVQAALVTEPMLVHANGMFRDRAGSYLRLVIEKNWVVSLILAAPLAIAAGICAALASDVAAPLLAIACAAPMVLYHWTARRACYAALRPLTAARINIVYLVAVPSAALLLNRFGLLTAVVAVLVMGLGSALAGWLMLRALRVPRDTAKAVDAGEVRAAHWRFGRWLLGSTGLRWAQGNAVIMLAPAFLGLGAAGELRVLGLVLMPVLQGVAAIGPLLSPILTRAREAGFVRTLWLALCSLAAITGAYYALLLVLGEDMLSLAFGDRYLHLAPLLAVYGLAPVFSALGSVLGAALQALLRTDAVFWASLVGACTAMVGTLSLVPPLGLTGAIISDVASTAALTLVLAVGLFFSLRRDRL